MLRRLKNWWIVRVWTPISPHPVARKGAVWAVLITAALAAFIGGCYLHSGFGLAVDLAFAFAIGLIGIPIVALLIALLLTMLRRAPRMASGFLVGGAIMAGLPFSSLGLPLSIVFGLVEGFFGAAIATMLFGKFREAGMARKIITLSFFVLTLATNVVLIVWIARAGSDAVAENWQAKDSPEPALLAAANPTEAGPYTVKTLTYGSGSDLRRPEYNKAAAIKTTSLDASRFFKDFKGWRANFRKRYWGFGMDKVPLNGRVWYPDGPGPFPLALIVHGNHNMAQFSDPGYEYLGTLLASRGFILASIDENFLNGGAFGNPPKEQAVRGWMLLEHLKLWHAWNAAPSNPFYRKVDLDRVALMGHSRGGEAAATAALFNRLAYYPDDATIPFHYGFPITSVVAIAPADGQYKPAGQWRYIENVNYLTLQGASDADVSSFVGSRQWDRVRYTREGPWFKAEIYAQNANHGQFNTSWGRTDAGEPLSWFLNLKPLMAGDDQRRISKTYITAFLEATLHDRREYVPLFRDYRRIRTWLPATHYMSRYLDASYRVITDFTEDPDVTTTTIPGGHIDARNFSIWREGRIPYRRGDRDYNGVFLGWNRGPKGNGAVPVYDISLPPGSKIAADSVLSMSLAVTDEKAPEPGKEQGKEPAKEDLKPEPVDFTIEIQTADGAVTRVPLSRFGVLPPPIKTRFTKLQMMDNYAYQKASEPVFQTIEVPLGSLGGKEIAKISLRFDRTPARVMILSQIGLAK